MIDWARIKAAAQFYNKNWKEGLTEIETAAEHLAKKTCIISSDIPQWSKKSLEQHVKKVEENLELLQWGKEEDAEVFIGNSTSQRDSLNMVSRMLKEHLKKVANITLERVPSQAKELLGMAVVNMKETANKDNTEMEPTNN